MVPTFLADFGYDANTPAALEVINGTYVPALGTDCWMVEFFKALAMTPEIRAKGPLDVSVTPEVNWSTWKKECKQKALEPSTLSFSHYKSACLDLDLNIVDTVLHSIPLMTSISLEDWHSITNVVIFKKTDKYQVAKMGLIQLMHPVYQIN